MPLLSLRAWTQWGCLLPCPPHPTGSGIHSSCHSTCPKRGEGAPCISVGRSALSVLAASWAAEVSTMSTGLQSFVPVKPGRVLETHILFPDGFGAAIYTQLHASGQDLHVHLGPLLSYHTFSTSAHPEKSKCMQRHVHRGLTHPLACRSIAFPHFACRLALDKTCSS